MREKTYYTERPEAYEISDAAPNGEITVYLRENIEEAGSGAPDYAAFQADEYEIKTFDTPSLAARVAENFSAWLARAKEDDYAREAKKIRAKRNELLSESDKELCIDRLGLTAPTGNTFEEWLPFLSQLGTVLAEDTAAYRQALRDIPEQEGFPYDVVFPEKP